VCFIHTTSCITRACEYLLSSSVSHAGSTLFQNGNIDAIDRAHVMCFPRSGDELGSRLLVVGVLCWYWRCIWASLSRDELRIPHRHSLFHSMRLSTCTFAAYDELLNTQHSNAFRVTHLYLKNHSKKRKNNTYTTESHDESTNTHACTAQHTRVHGTAHTHQERADADECLEVLLNVKLKRDANVHAAREPSHSITHTAARTDLKMLVMNVPGMNILEKMVRNFITLFCASELGHRKRGTSTNDVLVRSFASDSISRCSC
jgi:hypothetical protein